MWVLMWGCDYYKKLKLGTYLFIKKIWGPTSQSWPLGLLNYLIETPYSLSRHYNNKRKKMQFSIMQNVCQNEHLSILSKLSNKMSIFCNYLAKCPCFKLDFLKIEFQWKTRFLENQVMWIQTLKKKKLEFEFHVKFLTLQDVLKIEFQNRGILLNNFITNGILLHFLGERDKCSFWPQNVVT